MPSWAHTANEAFARCATRKWVVNFGSRWHGCKHAAWCLSSTLLAQHPQENYSEKYNQGVGNHCKPPPTSLNMALLRGWRGDEEKEGTERGAELPKSGVCFLLQPYGKPCCCQSPQQPCRAGVSMARQDRGWWHLTAPLLSPRAGRGKRSQPRGVAAARGGPFTAPHPSSLGRDRDAAAPVLGGLAPGAAGLCHTTAAWCISPGHVLLLGEGCPLRSQLQTPGPNLRAGQREGHSGLRLFVLFFGGRTLTFWKLMMVSERFWAPAVHPPGASA